MKKSAAIPASIVRFGEEGENLAKHDYARRWRRVSSDEEQRGGNGQPSHAIRRAVAQSAEYLPYVEAPSMEPAFGGVKSK